MFLAPGDCRLGSRKPSLQRMARPTDPPRAGARAVDRSPTHKRALRFSIERVWFDLRIARWRKDCRLYRGADFLLGNFCAGFSGHSASAVDFDTVHCAVCVRLDFPPWFLQLLPFSRTGVLQPGDFLARQKVGVAGRCGNIAWLLWWRIRWASRGYWLRRRTLRSRRRRSGRVINCFLSRSELFCSGLFTTICRNITTSMAAAGRGTSSMAPTNWIFSGLATTFPRSHWWRLLLIALAVDIIRRRHEPNLWKYYAIPLQLYVLVELSVYLLPGGIHFPPPTAALALLTERLTSVSAALVCCLLGAMQPRRWHLPVLRLSPLYFSASCIRTRRRSTEWSSKWCSWSASCRRTSA